MGRKQYTKEQLCRIGKQIEIDRKISHANPFTRISIICCYLLYKEENWKKRKLTKYMKITTQYHDLFNDDREQWEIQQERLLKEVGEILYIDVDEKPEYKKKDFISSMKNIQIQNEVYAAYQYKRYLLAHFNALLDLELDKERIIHNMKKIEIALFESDEDGEKAKKALQELIDKIGFAIESYKLDN